MAIAPFNVLAAGKIRTDAEEEAREHHALLLANHGPIAAGGDLAAAADAVEEIEETARIFLLLRNTETAPLTPDQVAALRA